MTLFLKSHGTQACLRGVAQNHLLGSKIFVERRFPRVTKSFVNKSFHKLVKNVMESIFSNLPVLGRNPWHV
jgi:hypothetical protein